MSATSAPTPFATIGPTPYPYDANGAPYIYVALAVIGTVYILVGLGFFIRRWNHEPIKSRGRVMAAIALFYGAVTFAVATLEMHYDSTPDLDMSCHVLLWVVIGFIPLYCFSYILRTYYLVFKATISDAKAKYADDDDSILSKPGPKSFFVEKKWATSLRFNLGLLIAFTVVTYAIALGLQFSGPQPDPFITTNHCLTRQVYLMIIQGCIMVALIVILVVFTWNIEDNYNLKYELKITLLGTTPLFALWALRLGTNVFPYWIKSTWFSMPFLIWGCTVSGWLPVYWTFDKRWKAPAEDTDSPTESEIESGVSQRRERASVLFDRMMEHTEMLNAFRKYLKQLWCVETIIFYKEVELWRKKFSSMDGEERQSTAERMVSMYFANDAVLEVNVDHTTRQKILHAVADNTIDIGLFDTAHKEVTRQLQFDSFPKFCASPAFRRACHATGFNIYTSSARPSIVEIELVEPRKEA